MPLAHRVAPVDLTLAAIEDERGLAAMFEYSTDLFDAATIARMAQSYCMLLEGIASDSEQAVSDLPMMPEHERRKLVEEWNATAAPYPTDSCLHQLIERQVEQTPHTLALVAGEERLTYRALNQQANQLAHYLRQLGVGPDSPVGLLCPRSAQALIGAIAILKAGGAYVPLDPTYPDERLAFMLRDINAPLLLTQRTLRPRLARIREASLGGGGLSDSGGMRVIYLDTDSSDASHIRQQSRHNPPLVVGPDHLAYIIYTSGSTGQPNGVALAHRGVVSLLTDFQRHQPLAPGDGCSWWTSLSFDVSVYEIFSAWLAGGTLHVIPEAVRLDAPTLLAWLHTHQIRSAYLPPFLLAEFARWVCAHPGASALRRLLVGVEPIAEQLLTSICAELPDLCLLNGYGPSETTICSTLYRAMATPPSLTSPTHAAPAHQQTPIGRPVANTQMYLLDRHMQLVPRGAVGEVYIDGVGLARGYWRRPELTATRFLPHRFSAQPGARLYRTGDMARLLPDGNLEFVGRRDSQVKLHGYRIELGEIEAALAQHPNVKQAAVVVRQEHSDEKRLVAYLTPIHDPPPSPNELRIFLAKSLPHAMVPSTFVVLDAFPLTPSGKVDRRALPAPHSMLRPQQERSFRGPRTEPRTNAERTLTTIWQQVLGVEQVGLNDNFFELGGDSILGIQIVARATDAGLHLTPRQVFEAPTVAGLAALADASAPMGIQPAQDILEGEVLLTPIQRWFFERDFRDPHHWNQALMFTTHQPLDPTAFRAAVAALLEHHDALRLRYTRTLADWSQTYAGRSEDIPCEVIDLSSLSESQQTTAIEERAAALQRGLDLSGGPLMRVAYFVLGESRPGRLLFVIHHLAIDGISWRILIEDFQTAYGQLQRGQPVRLPPKTTPYRDWAQRLTDFAQSPEIKEVATFWLGAAGDGLPLLPVDRCSSERASTTMNMEMNTEASSQRVSVCLSHEETQALLHNAPITYGAEINDVLLTALALAFARWTGSPTLWIDLEGHGREDIFDAIDLSRTVGWFTAMYPVRLDLLPDTEHSRAVQVIKEQLRRIPHHGLSYGMLRNLCADLALKEQLTAIPPAQVSFNYLGQLRQATEGGLLDFPAPESVGPLRSPDALRPHLLDIGAAIIQGKLRLDWTYSVRAHDRHTVESVASLFIEELRALIALCSSSEPTRKFAADACSAFSESAVHQIELDTSGSTPGQAHPVQADQALVRLNDDIEDIYPLSPMQQGMLFHTMVAPASGVYIQQITGDIQGALDVPAFASAWQRVLERNSILRTSFVGKRLDRMLQVVHKAAKMPLEILDWHNFSDAEQQAHFSALLTGERSRDFDLTIAPLMRLFIMRTADDTHRFLLTYHHVLLDGWSLALLFKELFTVYEALTRHEDLTLLPSRPYGDYIAWLQTQDSAAAEAFWRSALTGSAVTPVLPIRPGRRVPSSKVSVFQHAEHAARLSAQTTAALRAIAREQRLTLNTIVQGALALLLSRYAQQDEVLFGTTVSGRTPALAGIENMIGLFLNTLPLRVVVDPQALLIEWLQQLQHQAIKARQYDYSSLVQIHDWSGI
ncbi:MAG TPA: amino acid adenylation domain-containing protein, partial [Ktedonobacterales bacterium]|nr:amino acid adenylation domain-containing protein [Ktedonobacterales bacterium]